MTPPSAAAVAGVLVSLLRLVLIRAGTPYVGTLTVVVMVRPVPPMHEQVHERAGEQKQPGQRRNDVRSVLGQ
jgi:hypothetical protein